jgi:hypothetical protein
VADFKEVQIIIVILLIYVLNFIFGVTLHKSYWMLIEIVVENKACYIVSKNSFLNIIEEAILL